MMFFMALNMKSLIVTNFNIMLLLDKIDFFFTGLEGFKGVC